MGGQMTTWPPKPRVYQQRRLGHYCACHPRKPCSETPWLCWYPYLSYPDNVMEFETWQEAIECALKYRPPTMMNHPPGSNNYTYTFFPLPNLCNGFGNGLGN